MLVALAIRSSHFWFQRQLRLDCAFPVGPGYSVRLDRIAQAAGNPAHQFSLSLTLTASAFAARARQKSLPGGGRRLSQIRPGLNRLLFIAKLISGDEYKNAARSVSCRVASLS